MYEANQMQCIFFRSSRRREGNNFFFDFECSGVAREVFLVNHLWIIHCTVMYCCYSLRHDIFSITFQLNVSTYVLVVCIFFVRKNYKKYDSSINKSFKLRVRKSEVIIVKKKTKNWKYCNDFINI